MFSGARGALGRRGVGGCVRTFLDGVCVREGTGGGLAEDPSIVCAVGRLTGGGLTEGKDVAKKSQSKWVDGRRSKELGGRNE